MDAELEAPPYSPTATAGESHLAHDFHSPSSHPRCQDSEDPLQSLSRTKPCLTTHSRCTSVSPTSSMSPRTIIHSRNGSLPSPSFFSSSDDENTLWHIATTPTIQSPTAPFLFPINSPTTTQLPPEYAPVDELARSFRLEAPFIYTTKTSSLPRYQLMQDFTRSGRPRQLNIRRLMASETRSYSLPSPSAPTFESRLGSRIKYDEDGTMYSITSYDMHGLNYPSKSCEMRGHRSSTIPGSIRLETGRSIGGLGGRWCKIWLWTKNARRDSLNPENEARMQKYGYHADAEWDKRVLFQVKRGKWEDGAGREVAREDGGTIEVSELVGREAWRRDLLIASWMMKVWMAEGVRWEGDVKS